MIDADRTPVVEVRGLTKSYGPVRALDGVDLEVYPREIHALVGDNGAGKSSMIKALSGAIVPDEGTAALGVRQTEQVLQLIARIRDEQGLAVILITHALPEVFRVADRVSVMRLGRRVHVSDVADITTEGLIAAMTGVSGSQQLP